MTQKQVNEMGFSVNGLFANGRLYHPTSETDFRVTNIKKIKPSELIDIFHNVAFKNGESWGMTQKIEEIKTALNIKP